MKLFDFLDESAVLHEMKASNKEEAIAELVNALVDTGRVAAREAEEITRAMMDREALGSTGIGRGIAMPHAKHEFGGELVVAFGRSTAGIEFDALDGEPVHVIFLMLSSPEEGGAMVAALGYISRLLRNANFSRFLQKAVDHDEIIDTLREMDEGNEGD